MVARDEKKKVGYGLLYCWI